jgi:Cu/Ag efflux protein CusF
MKTFLIGAAIAGLVAVPLARAGEQPSTTDKTSAQQSSSSQTTAPSQATPSQTAAPSQATPSQTGVTATASKDLSGTVKKVDQGKRSLKISSAAGGEQEVKVAEGAKIVTSDGAQASLGEIKEGDQVRASFDSSSDQASQIEVSSKQKVKTDEKSKTMPEQK